MPLYFFDIRHDALHVVEVGTDLPNKDVAWEEATRTAGDSIKDIDGKLKPGHDWSMQVYDEFRNPLWEIHVKAKKNV